MEYVILQSLTYIIGVLYVMLGIGKNCSIKRRIISALVIALSISFFARIFWAIENYNYFATGVYSIGKIFEFKIGNFKIIGVMIGALVGMFALCKIYKENARSIMNASIEAMFLTAGYTKLVCAIMGECCLGKRTSVPWAISYPERNMHNLHPTAAYEVITWWICFALLHILKDKVKPDSSRISFCVFIYVAVRFFILEGLYAHTPFMGNIKARIIYSTIIVICIVVIAFNTYKNKKNIKTEEEK